MANLNPRFRQNLGYNANGKAYTVGYVKKEIERWVLEHGGGESRTRVHHRSGDSRGLIIGVGESEGSRVGLNYFRLGVKEFNEAGKGPRGEEEQLKMIAGAIEEGLRKVNQEIESANAGEKERLKRIADHLKSLLA